MSNPPCDDGAVNDIQITNKQTKDIIMKSYELLRQVLKKVGIKQMAAELKLSPSLLYQWSRAEDGQSAALNPLDRVVQLAALPGGVALLEWLCRQAGGRFVRGKELRALACQECERRIAELRSIVTAADGSKQPGDRRWKLGVGGKNHLPSANSQLPGARAAGGSRCQHRRADGRCGWRAARRN